MVSDRAVVLRMCIPCGKTVLFGAKVKVFKTGLCYKELKNNMEKA